jgi:hypothetical protein
MSDRNPAAHDHVFEAAEEPRADFHISVVRRKTTQHRAVVDRDDLTVSTAAGGKRNAETSPTT